MTDRPSALVRSRSHWRYVLGTLKVAVSAAILIVLVRRIEVRAIAAQIQNLDLVWIAAAAGLLVVQFVLTAWRWQRVNVAIDGPKLTLRELAWALGASQFYGSVAPSSLGGDVVRTAAITSRVGLRAASRSVIADRLSGFVLLAAIAAASLPLLAWRAERTWLITIALAIAGGITIAALAVTHPDRWLRRIPFGRASASIVLADLSSVWGRSAIRGQIALSGLLVHAVAIFLLFLLARATRLDIGVMPVLLVAPVSLLLTALPISVAGWGVREGAIAAGFRLLGLPVVDGVTVSVLYGLTGPAMGLTYALLRAVRAVARREEKREVAPISGSHAGVGTADLYDSIADDWDEIFGEEAVGPFFAQARWDALESMLAPTTPAPRALELGVGTGVYVERTASSFGEIIAVDSSPKMLEALSRKLAKRKIHNVYPHLGDAQRLPGIGTASIDVVYFIGLLEALKDREPLMQELARVVRPGGAVVGTTSNGRSPWFALRDRLIGLRYGRVGEYPTVAEVEFLAAKYRFTLEDVRYWGTTPPRLRSPLIGRLLIGIERRMRTTPLAKYFAAFAFRLRRTDEADA